MKEAFESELKALLEKYGFEAKIEITEKKRSLKLDDICEEQKNEPCFYLNEKGINDGYFSSFLSPFYSTDQIKESSARKSMLYGQIQRIADFANGDWVENKHMLNWIIYSDQKLIKVGHIPYNCGQPVFKTKDLAEQAYEDNQEIFDEFLKL